jgi:outer membrane protein OmpA-like peptidoglycan-associated protein
MMRHITHAKILVLVALIAAFALSGCGTAKNPALEKARAAYNEAYNNPDISVNAPVAMDEAKKTLEQADKAEKEEDKVRLAGQLENKVKLAKANAEEKIAEKKREVLKKEKQDMLLESRQREADRAKTEAERAKMDAEAKARELAAQTKEAEMARKQAEDAKNQTAQMKAEADAKAKEAQAALLAAQQAKAEADAKAKEAEESRKQAEAAKAEAELLKKELSDLKAKETERGLVLTLGDVLFATGKAELNYNAMRNLDKLAEFLKKYPTRNILVEGHTDSRGSESMNLTLSQNRADSVRNALVSRGVDGTRITAKGYGKSQPVADNATESGRSQNRRVEIVILKEGKTQ